MHKTHKEVTAQNVYFELWKNYQDMHFNLLMQIFGLNTETSETSLRPALEELIEDGLVTYYPEKKRYKAVNSLQDLLIVDVIPDSESNSYDIAKPLHWPLDNMPEPLIKIKKGLPKSWPHLIHVRRSGPHLLAKSIAEITPQHPARIHGRVVDTELGRKLVPLFHRYHTDFDVAGSEKPLVEDGDIVIANLDPMHGSVQIIDYDLDALPLQKYSKMVVASRGLNPHFNQRANAEAAEIFRRPIESAKIDYRDLPFAEIDERIDPSHRVDYRDLPLVTVDGPYAKDYDDAVSPLLPDDDPDNKGGSKLFVAIADVTADVHPEVDGAFSYLDGEAYNRGSSIYFPDGVVPMFPFDLSSNRFSLMPNEDRMAMVCEIKLAEDARVISHTFRSGLIRSHARMTYAQLDDVIAHGWDVPGLPEDFAENMLLADRILPDSPIFRDRLEMGLI